MQLHVSCNFICTQINKIPFETSSSAAMPFSPCPPDASSNTNTKQTLAAVLFKVFNYKISQDN